MSFQRNKNKFYDIHSKEELVSLANEMKMDAVKEKVTESPEPYYSKNEVEARERAEQLIAKNNSQIGSLACIIFYKGNPYGLCLTVDVYDGPEWWHLSISKIDVNSNPFEKTVFLRADDETTKFISEAFFDSPQEGSPEGFHTNIRHFRAAKIFRSDNQGA